MITIESWELAVAGFILSGTIGLLMKVFWRKCITVESDIKNLAEEVHSKASHNDVIVTVDRLQLRLDSIQALILDLSKK